MPETFDTFIEREIFSELYGFVLCDPVGLDEFHGGSATGLDLLTQYSTSDEGDEVSKRGIAIPIMGVEANDYTLVIRSETEPTVIHETPKLISKGWILQVRSQPLCLCGAGYLTNWNPNHPKVLRPRVPPGWYNVEIHCGFSAGESPDWIIEFVLYAATDTPAFSADLQTDFNFIDR